MESSMTQEQIADAQQKAKDLFEKNKLDEK